MNAFVIEPEAAGDAAAIDAAPDDEEVGHIGPVLRCHAGLLPSGLQVETNRAFWSIRFFRLCAINEKTNIGAQVTSGNPLIILRFGCKRAFSRCAAA